MRKYKINKTALTAIFILFCGINLRASGLNFGPVQAVNQKVDEYNTKMKQKAIDNGTTNVATQYGTVKGNITNAIGVPPTFAKVNYDNLTYNYVYIDTTGNYTLSNVPAGIHTISATNNYSRMITSTVTVVANTTIINNMAFDWLVLSSPLTGTYSDDSKLSTANSPYTVNANVTLNNLFIEPGVVVKFSGAYSFTVSGSSTIIIGTSSSPVKFTSGRVSPAAGDYTNVQFGYSGNTTQLQLNYVNFEYGTYVDLFGASNSTISNCTFNSLSAYPQIGDGTVSHCNFMTNAYGIGVSISGTPHLSYCNIADTIYAPSTAGQYSVNNCNLTKGSSPIISNAANWTFDLTNNWWGTTTSATIAGYITSSVGTINYTPYLSSTVTAAGPQ